MGYFDKAAILDFGQRKNGNQFFLNSHRILDVRSKDFGQRKNENDFFLNAHVS